MVLVAIMGIGLAKVGEVWYVAERREKERELLFIGNQFRLAIARYAASPRGAAQRFPMHLEDLLKDPRFPGVQRYLRRIYVDPMTGDDKWGLVQGPAGEILGVYSLSEDEPIKQGNFSLADAKFEGRSKYSEWVFMYASQRASVAVARAPSK